MSKVRVSGLGFRGLGASEFIVSAEPNKLWRHAHMRTRESKSIEPRTRLHSAQATAALVSKTIYVTEKPACKPTCPVDAQALLGQTTMWQRASQRNPVRQHLTQRFRV